MATEIITLDTFNSLPKDSAVDLLFTCCGSSKWCQAVVSGVPYASLSQLLDRATAVWYEQCGAEDWKEAFKQHPKIGDQASIQKQFAATAHLAGEEQSGVSGASTEIIRRLALANESYERKFGYIFIVSAAGKSAMHMLRLLEERSGHEASTELLVAMGEQHKITLRRLSKLFHDDNTLTDSRSQLTTHVLDTAKGKPAPNITVKLQQEATDNWQTIALGITNEDGRIGDLLPSRKLLPPNVYRLVFGVGAYFNETVNFYPNVEITFWINDSGHYHVPLLISPFGYSTYRGS